MKGVCNLLQELKAIVLMVFVQIVYAAGNVLYKLAINDGMSITVATVYRLILASAFTIPIALIFDRKKRSKITWRVLFLGFLCGLFGGSLFLNLYFEGLALTSTTFMMAMLNLNPGITFIMVILFGFEKLNLGAAEGRAKVMGTIIGISGAMILTFVKGVEINIWCSKVNLIHPHKSQNGWHGDFSNKFLGVPCAIGSCCSFCLWYIIQAKLNEEYPSHLSSSALMSIMGTIQAVVFALCIERDWSQWKLGYNITLLTVAYSGIMNSGIVVIVIAWCIKMRGPLFASIFGPLQLLLVAVASYLMLNEKLYLGSLLGAALIVCGLYTVLWGKGKEIKKKTHLVSSETARESETVEVACYVHEI
ncbi:WAT1-related protein At1g25270-like [Abrus precatorius]|uniref:WAT1-related protein n=1 Tax=Abrus precatorius TaxID=3816 RepID=A0A8B8KWX2_ABRPR|nr:WAT1-related protein At1g25270-like [Abrus precatorius]